MAESSLGHGQKLPRMCQQTREQSDGQTRQRPGWRRVSKASRGPQGDPNDECWGKGQEKCGTDFPKALASDLPNCPHARQAGDKRD